MLNKIINSSLRESIFGIILESQESKSIDLAKKLLTNNGYSREESDNFVRVTLRSMFPTLRNRKCGKFILGMTRLYLYNELNSYMICSQINSILKLISSNKYYDSYDKNLNGYSALDLISIHQEELHVNYDNEKSEIDNYLYDNNSNYTIIKINSFDDARKYYKYFDESNAWCITYDNDLYNTYNANGKNQIYFCLRNDFETVQQEIGNNCPLDDYGLSMLSVIVNEEGRLVYCTCRWNHENGGNDYVMKPIDISKTISLNFYNVFKPNDNWRTIVYKAFQDLNNGTDPNDVFDEYYSSSCGLNRFVIGDKTNFIDNDFNVLSEKWFDGADDFIDGISIVVLNGKFNYLNSKEELLSNDWFDMCFYFNEGFAQVEKRNKSNYIDKNGHILSDKWFDWSNDFHNGYAEVKLDGKTYIIDANGNLSNT